MIQPPTTAAGQVESQRSLFDIFLTTTHFNGDFASHEIIVKGTEHRHMCTCKVVS
jgi:hypothetical protein